MIEGCPPQYDPHKNCIACDACFERFDDLKAHMQNVHPEFVAHWKSILHSWEIEC